MVLGKAGIIEGIAFYVKPGDSLTKAIERAKVRHREKFDCAANRILVSSKTAEGLVVQGLTVVSDPPISYTFLMYREEEKTNETSTLF